MRPGGSGRRVGCGKGPYSSMEKASKPSTLPGGRPSQAIELTSKDTLRRPRCNQAAEVRNEGLHRSWSDSDEVKRPTGGRLLLG